MKVKQYIKELNHNLKTLNNNDKEEIIKEIQSYVDESNCTYEELCSKFGNANELASSYLSEDNEVKEIKKRSISDKILIFMGFLLLIIGLAVSYMYYIFTSDDFDYSKYNSKTIVKKIKEQWISVDNLDKINLNQSKVIVYWTNEDKIKYTCKGDNVRYINSILNLKQKYCYIVVPKKQLDIKLYQSTLIIIEPKANINLNLEQAQIRIFENKKQYMYSFKNIQSKISDIKSNKSIIKIEGKLLNSTAEYYKY